MINGTRAWLKLLLFSVSYVHVLVFTQRYKFRDATLLQQRNHDDLSSRFDYSVLTMVWDIESASDI
jgi:hypothetical protein